MSFLLIALHERPLWECPQGMYPESEGWSVTSAPGRGMDARLYSPQLPVFSMHDPLTHHLVWICERLWGEGRGQQPVLGQDAGVFTPHQVWLCAFETLFISSLPHPFWASAVIFFSPVGE